MLEERGLLTSLKYSGIYFESNLQSISIFIHVWKARFLKESLNT